MSNLSQYEQAVVGGEVALQLLTETAENGDEERMPAAIETASWNLMSASVHAALAQVDAIRELTAAVREFRRGA